MGCRETRRLLAERESDRLAAGCDGEMSGHLATCPECRTHAAIESRLTAGLLLLRERPVPAVDVLDRVMTRLATAPRPAANAPSVRQLAGSVAAAVLAGFGLAAGLWQLAPNLSQLAARAPGLAAAAASLVARAAESLLALVARGLGLAGDLLRAGGIVLAGLEPFVTAVSVVSGLILLTTIVLVVGRDLRGSAHARVAGER